MTLPEVKTWPQFTAELAGAKAIVWCTPSAVGRMQSLSPWPVVTEQPRMADGGWLIAVGGGLLIDQAKLERQETAGVKLAAIPTLWGSGAEFSPIAVWMEGGKKLFRRDPALLPDVAIYLREFAETLSPELVRWGCGDAWAHALEGFLSPLASDETRLALVSTLQRMLNLGAGKDAQWFELSGLACAGQATSSVGLVHGIAHTLEGKLGLGHARLCATLLIPVMRFNQSRSPKWPLLVEYGLNDDAIFPALAGFFNAEDYAKIREALPRDWKNVLRDPCTRTNSALLRPADLEFFVEFQP